MYRRERLRCRIEHACTLVAVLLLASLVLQSPGASAQEPGQAGESATVGFSVSESSYPADGDHEAWRQLAERAANFDSYRVYDAEIQQRSQVIDRFVALRTNDVQALQPSIDELRARTEESEGTQNELQPVVDRMSSRLSGLAIQNYKSGNDHSALPVDVNGSQAFERRLRTEQTLERVVGESAVDLKIVSEDLAEVLATLEGLRGELAVVESQQQANQERLAAAQQLAEGFAKQVAERAAKLEALSGQAVSSEESNLTLYKVGPFTVNAQIAQQLALMLAAAEQDGINFGGWGHRTISRQIELRRSHCGDSEYAIYQMPSSQCSPPTARPGNSQHEVGLAIDFTENGSTLTRSSPGFIWLRQHAAAYGLKNLPSEPWHWSTTGN